MKIRINRTNKPALRYTVFQSFEFNSKTGMATAKGKSVFGKSFVAQLHVTLPEVTDWLMTNNSVQYAFPRLSAEDREVFITGVTPDQWHAYLHSTTPSINEEV